MKTYRTISGQTWDQIAYEVYGDEHYAGNLMDANRDHLDEFVFSDGIELEIPDIEDIKKAEPAASDYPEWRALLDGRK